MLSVTSPAPALFAKKHRALPRLDELFEFAPRDGAQEDLVLWFVQFVDWLRPRRQSLATRLRFVEAQLAQHPEYLPIVSATLTKLLEHTEIDRLLAYGGIPLDFHFGGAVKEWFLDRVLPSACKTEDGAQILRLAFVERDLAWLGNPDVFAFFRRLIDPSRVDALGKALREAIVDLAHQIVAQAHAPSIRCLAQEERSPYRGLCEAAASLNEVPDDSALNGLRGRVQQCILLLRSHRCELVDRGADLNTTFQLTRMHQQLERLTLLGRLRHDSGNEVLGQAAWSLVHDALQSGSGKRLVTRSADLVIQNLVDAAANVGWAYLDDERSSWGTAFRAGAAGGGLMAIATLVKFSLARLHLPTLYEGLAFSLNYAAVFCMAYALQATIATKLPAHTAAALARSAQQGRSHRARLRAFVAVWRTTLRLQLAGLLGNVVVAGPLAFVLDLGTQRLLGHHLLSNDEAEHVLRSTSVFGPSIFYAALTGIFLWLSSLIGAWGDNWTRVNRLADRLATNRQAMTRFSPAQARSYADAVVQRAGGLLGNASLGFLLGSVPAAFAIAHLPVEIRHVTVSTSSVALALAARVGTESEAVFAMLGLVVIATVNVAVSFLLALWLALRATRGIRASGSSHALVRIGLRRWARSVAAPSALGSAPVAELPVP